MVFQNMLKKAEETGPAPCRSTLGRSSIVSGISSPPCVFTAISRLSDPVFKEDSLPCGAEDPGEMPSAALIGGNSGEIHVWKAVRASKGKSNIYRTGNIDSADVKLHVRRAPGLDFSGNRAIITYIEMKAR